MILDTWGWCTETTQKDGTGREVGRGFRMGNTCIPVADSCWCMAKPIQYCKVINLQLNKFILKKKLRLCGPPRSSLLDVFWMFAGWCSLSLESSFYLDFGRQGWKQGRWSEQMFVERGWCSGLGKYNWTNGFIWEKVLRKRRLVVVGWIWRLKGREGSWGTPVYDLT